VRYELTQVDVSCPACGAQSARVLYSVDAPQAAAHYVIERVEPERFAALVDHLQRLWSSPTCRVVRCDQCGLCFADPFVAGDREFYTLAYRRRGYPPWKWEYRITLETLNQELAGADSESTRMLEIGAGDGAFIRRLPMDLIRRENIVCTEYSDYALGRLAELGVTTHAGDVRDLRGVGDVSVVCMFQVFEHTDGLDDLFDALGRLTAPGADLFAAVPNDRRIEFYERHGALLDMPPNHVSRWTRGAFEALAKRHGWRLIRHEIEPAAPVAFFKRYAVYRYLRRRRKGGTLSNRVAAVRCGICRRVCEIALVAAFAVCSLPLLPRMFSPELGNAQWVHLKKEGSDAHV